MNPFQHALTRSACLVLIFFSVGALADIQYVGPGGDCGVLSPCNATVAAAVGAATAPADIRLLPDNYTENVDITLFNAPTNGDILFQGVDAAGAPSVGTSVFTSGGLESLGLFTGNFELRGLSFTGGADIQADIDGNVAMLDISVTGPPAGGIRLEVTGPADILFQDIVITDSGGEGIILDTLSGVGTPVYNITMTQVTTNNNEETGIEINQALGVGEDLIVNLTMSQIRSNNNNVAAAANGIEAAVTKGTVQLTDITTNNNSADGVDLEDGATVTLTNVTANGNGDEGLEVDAESMLTATRITARNNSTAGLLIEGADQPGGGGGGGGQVLGDVSVTDLFVSGNNDGLYFEDLTAASTVTVREADFVANTRSGIFIEDDSDADGTVDARGNFWGSSSGPTHTDNPGGTGDTVADAANSIDNSTGIVLYDGFATSPVSGSSAGSPPAVGIPVFGDSRLLLLILVLAGFWVGARRIP